MIFPEIKSLDHVVPIFCHFARNTYIRNNLVKVTPFQFSTWFPSSPLPRNQANCPRGPQISVTLPVASNTNIVVRNNAAKETLDPTRGDRVTACWITYSNFHVVPDFCHVAHNTTIRDSPAKVTFFPSSPEHSASWEANRLPTSSQIFVTLPATLL